MNGGEAGGQDKLVPASTRSLSSPSSALVMRGLEFLAEKQIDHASKLLGKGDKAGAVQQFREALNLTPMWAAARLCLAKLLEGMGDIRGGIAEYREVLRVISDDDGIVQLAHMNIGRALMDAGDFSSAILEFREVIRLESDYAPAHKWLGGALVKSGDLQGAIAEYLEAIRLKPGDVTSHLGLGQALHATGELENAATDFYLVLYFAKDCLSQYEEETEIARNALRDMGLPDDISWD